MVAKPDIVTLEQVDAFDALIDARSPSEFAHDHLPGAINCPVLDDEQRRIVGTIYKQRGPFEARRIGGAWVARNIAAHVERLMQDKPVGWRPLVYCWRGGQRSGAFVLWLRQIGWPAAQLRGGYKAYREVVRQRLQSLPGRLRWRMLAGPTGSGKTRLLQALAARGAQVVDLEALARHRGSVLGDWPGGLPQPSQKAFDTALVEALARLDPSRPVWVEAESRRIGSVQLPLELSAALAAAPKAVLEVPFAVRLDLVTREYGWLADDRPALTRRLERLRGLHANATLTRWLSWAQAGQTADLFAELMQQHYDPLYLRHLSRGGPPLRVVDLPALDDATLDRVAEGLLHDNERAAGSPRAAATGPADAPIIRATC